MPGRHPRSTALTAVGAALVGFMVVLIGLLAGTGWLYVFRGLGWFAIGPSIGDALPLLQLASFDPQPLLRVVLAWLLAGGLAGVGLGAFSPWRRGALALGFGLVLLLLGSQVAYALTRNLSLSGVLFHRRPGAGPVVEACAFAAGAVLVGSLPPLLGSMRDHQPLGVRRAFLTRFGRLHDRSLGGG